MRTLHKIAQERIIYNDFIKAVLWWITVGTYAEGDQARIVNDHHIDRVLANGDSWDYTPEDVGTIIEDWIGLGKPDYLRKRVIKG